MYSLIVGIIFLVCFNINYYKKEVNTKITFAMTLGYGIACRFFGETEIPYIGT